MDMILERVQNKFACIIGELCSEPVVLSKFAIWLDLRLAEYKLKGAISLDCSGESPDPGWLKGHEKQPEEPDIVSEFPVQKVDRSELVPSILPEDSPNFSDPLSEDVVVIKEEAEDDVLVDIYPVSIHKTGIGSTVHRPRKRPGVQTLAASSSKISRQNERVPPSSHYTDQPGNQSLMSIIGDNGDATSPDNDFSLLIPQSQDNSSSLTQTREDTSGQQTLPVLDTSLSADDSTSTAAFQSFHSSDESSFSQHTPQASDKRPEDIKPCPECGKIFYRKDSLYRHRLLHNPAKMRHVCPDCGIRFHRKEHLRNHMRNKHRLLMT